MLIRPSSAVTHRGIRSVNRRSSEKMVLYSACWSILPIVSNNSELMTRKLALFHESDLSYECVREIGISQPDNISVTGPESWTLLNRG